MCVMKAEESFQYRLLLKNKIQNISNKDGITTAV